MRNRDRRRQGWRAVVIALSLGAHLALLAALLSTLVYSPLPAPPVMQVQLTPAPSSERRERAATPVAPARSAPPARAPSSPVFRAGSPSPAAPVRVPVSPAAPPRPAPAAPIGPAPARAAAEQVREGLRLSVGCDTADLLGLSRRERDLCNEARAARTRDDPLPMNDAVRRARAARATDPSGPGLKFVTPPRTPDMLDPPIMVGTVIPFGKPPKAITPIAPSTLRGDDDALRPRPSAGD